ncbi:SUMF1/EgtB/PvdO family nonheme iron enzyme [Candidatus Latescibacterota bacterium]
MFCDKCGTENRDTAEYCSNCGTELSGISDNKSPSPSPESSTKQSSFVDRFKQAVSGRYEIVRELGRGGMAIVFLAKDKRLEREVAIKLLPEEFHHDESFRTRFIREARVSAKLSHPNIIQIHDVNELGDFTYFSMSYIEGVPLSTVLKKGDTFDPRVIARLAIHVCFALQHAHENNVIHRDIKPENILINKKRMPIVVDFGIAKALSEAKLSQTGMLIGTPHYMSPEQIKTGEVDGRSDLYSLGILLYEMVVGKTPFQGLDPTALMYHQVNEIPPAPHDANDKILVEFSDLVMKTLAKNPDDRYQTAAELGKALHQFMQGADTSAPKAGAAAKKKAVSPDASKRDASAPSGTSETIVAGSDENVARDRDSESADSIGDTLVAPKVSGKKRSPAQDKEEDESKSGIGVIAGAIGVISALIIVGLLGMNYLKKDDVPILENIPAQNQSVEESQPILKSSDTGTTAPTTQGPTTSKPIETASPKTIPPTAAPQERPPQQETTPETVKTEAVVKPPVTRPESRRVDETPSETIPAETTANAVPARPAPTQPEREVTKVPESKPVAERPRSAPVREIPVETSPPVQANEQRQIASIPKQEPEQPAPVRVPEREVQTTPVRPQQSVATITWIPIPRGTFEMGDVQGDMPEEMMNRPVHRVTLSNFEMSRDEVTVEQYAVFIKDTNHPRPTNWQIQIKFPKRPVVFVSWDDAVAFSKWVGGRLPTEAEWEYAARGGIKGGRYPWGNNPPDNRANFNNDWENGNGWVKFLKDAGSYPPNKYGLNDMAGNVYEWCHDWFGPYTDRLSTNPAGASSSNYGRVVRGGGWNTGSKYIRNSVRGPINPSEKLPHTGFRVVRGRPLN